jgi:hypothetical protein
LVWLMADSVPKGGFATETSQDHSRLGAGLSKTS